MTISNTEDFALRMLVALVLGSLIGAERQFRQRLAGLRTNALVCVGAALFVSMSALDRSGDPMRIAAQVVSGIGFLAGGVIFREGLSVQGLNTAATLWSTAAVGSLAGFGFAIEAAIGTAVILFVHAVLRPLGGAINARAAARAENTVTVTGERLESVASKLGIESGVTPVSWKRVPPATAEREMLPEV